MKIVRLTTVRAFCVLLMLLLSVMIVKAQSTQRGLVQEYHGTDPKTPLRNVSVAATNAGAVISDDKGEFTLSFRTLHPGDAIQFRRVELSGYEVMNQEALEVARVARNNENDNQNEKSLTVNRSPLTIIMVKREALRALRDGYRSVAVQRYEKQLKASEEEIERLKQEGKLAEEQYNERMNALEEAYEEKLSKLDSYIDKFARIDLSALDAQEQQIIDLVQAGKFDEALEIYDKQNLADRLRQSREDQKKLTSMRDQLAEAAQQKALENERLRQSIDRQITLLQMAGGEENLMKVHNLRHQVFMADTTHLQSRADYANSLCQHDMAKEACDLMKNGFNCHKDVMSQVDIWYLIAVFQIQLGDYAAALDCTHKADSLLSPMLDTDYTLRSRILPGICTNYLVIEDYIQTPDFAQRLEHCLQYWEPDTMDVNSLDKYTFLLSKLSYYYSTIGSHEKSVWATREGLKLGEVLQRHWPWVSSYWANCAVASSTFVIEGLREEAVQASKTYLELLAHDLKARSSTFMVIHFAYNSYLTLDALVNIEEYALADSLIQLMDQWKVIEKVLKKYPKSQDEIVGQFELNKSFVLAEQGKTEESETLANQALNRLDAADYIAHLRPGSLARIRMTQGRHKEAETLYLEAIAQSKKIYDAEPNDYDADTVCRYYVGLCRSYMKQGDMKAARKALKQAERYATFEYDRQLIKEINIK